MSPTRPLWSRVGQHLHLQLQQRSDWRLPSSVRTEQVGSPGGASGQEAGVSWRLSVGRETWVSRTAFGCCQAVEYPASGAREINPQR